MKHSKFVEEIKKPLVYGSLVDSVEMIQTHISFVVLAGDYAYKIKKPVDFGFLDFSTLDKRKHFCEEEIRLNSRLCPDIYLEVITFTETDDGMLELDGGGKIVEYAVKMKRFPQKNIMTKLLQQEKISKKVIENICSILVSFYKSDKSTEEIKEYGNKNSVKQNIDENFEQTKNVIDVTIPKDMYQFIQHASEKFFDMKSDLFNRRIQDGFIHDCHGDLHSGNIVVDGSSICIFDCIEFNKRFRFADVASDIGFLAMDLDYMNHPYLSSYLISNYIEKSKDVGIFDMLNFYKSYRAYVRGKVIGFRLNDPNIPKDEKQDIINTTKKYFDLSQYYASLFSLDLENKKSLLFVVGGLTGTGKSTLSLKISVDYHAHNINTDVVRKELAGIDKFERHHDEIDTGLYSPERIDHTYEQVMKKSADFLKNGENVVLDATFQRKKYRDMAKKVAKENNAVLVPIKCTCPEEIVKKWLEERLKTKTASDGRWEIYLNQKKTFESFTAEENCVVMDVSEESYKDRMDSFRRLLSKVHDGEK